VVHAGDADVTSHNDASQSTLAIMLPVALNIAPQSSVPVSVSPAVFLFLPARRYASAGNRHSNVSVRPSVRPSVTRRYCVKTKKASGMISSPSGIPKTLVFCCQISSPNSKGFPPNVRLKEEWVGKIQRFSSFKRQYLENGSRYGQSYY